MTFADWLVDGDSAWALILGALAATLITALLIRGWVNPFWSCVIGPFALGCVAAAICICEGVAAGHVRDAGDLKYIGIPLMWVVMWGSPGTLIGAIILALIGRRRRYRTEG